MPRSAKVVIWIVVFAACAGAGAYVAAHTDPFPPGVDDPGARSEASEPSPGIASGAPRPDRWVLRLESTSTHTVRVGGACDSDWTGRITLRVDQGGAVEGNGAATLTRAGCDFPVAQQQSEIVSLTFEGRVDDGGTATIEASAAAVTPAGSRDLGGLVETIRGATFVLVDGFARVEAERSDGAEGTLRSETTLTCLQGCDG